MTKPLIWLTVKVTNMNKPSMAIKWLQEKLTKLLIWLTAKIMNKPSMTIQQFHKKFEECLVSKTGENAAEKYGAESWDGVVFCEVNKTKCVYWIERDTFPVVFSVDKIWEQEQNRFHKARDTGQSIPAMQAEFGCYLLWQSNKLAGFTKHCDEIVLRDVGQVTDVYCIERKEVEPREDKRWHVTEQLQGGANCVFENLNSGGNIRFSPVLVAKLHANPITPAAYKYPPVMLNDKPYLIKRLEEGERLPDIQNGI